MTAGLRKALEARRRAVAAQAARELLNGAGPPDGTLGDLRRIDTVLGALPPPRHRRAVPLAVGLAALLIVALAWLTPIGALGLRTALHLDAAAGSVGLTPAEALDWQPGAGIAPAEARLTAGALSGWPGLEGTATLAPLAAGSLSLSRLRVPAGGRIDIARTGAGGVEIGLQGPGALAELLVSGDGALDGTAFAHEVPEVLRLASGESGLPPVLLTLAPAEPLRLRALPVTAVRFGVPDAGGSFASSLHRATLRLPQTGAAQDLGPGDALVLDDLDARVVELVADPGAPGVRVVLQGSARRVDLDRAGIVRAATPSVLTYVFENQRIAFLFGAVSALWGLIWSARRLLWS